MFYDHRILTQRKYGVATVWLVATIGPKAMLSKKIHKREILEVNVAKACRTILQSENPLALRLQSNLLFGVSRVFSEQYSYLFTDVANAHQKINREFLVPLDTAQIDLVGARIRPEALLLQDDPAFIPELSFILPELRVLPEDQLHNTTQLALQDDTLLPLPALDVAPSPRAELIIPDSPSLDGGSGGVGFLQFCGDDFQGGTSDQDELDEDIDFIFDENGEIQDVPARAPYQQTENGDMDIEDIPPRTTEGRIDTLGRDHWLTMSADRERVWREHEDGQQNHDLNNNLVNIDALQEKLFPTRNSTGSQGAEPFPLRQQECQEDEMAVVIPKQHGKKPRLARADDTLELKTSDLAALSANYLENMNLARQKRFKLQNAYSIKKTARGWVYGWGGMIKVRSLQATFGGNNMLKLLNPSVGKVLWGETSTTKRQKRAQLHSEEDESGSEGSQWGRRVRAERADDRNSRSVSPGIDEIDVEETGLEDQDPGVARRGSMNLEGSLMPWNILERGSRAGSELGFGGFGTSSIGGIPSSINRDFSSTGRRKASPAIVTSRLLGKRAGRVTPSPNISRIRAPVSDFGAKTRYGSPMNMESDGDDLFGAEEMTGVFHEEFQPEEGPGRDASFNKDTQNSNWFAETLERESYNFFEYLRFQIVSKYENEQGTGNENRFISLDELISPVGSPRVVAAQGFYHLLHLATRGSIRVEQHGHLEPIVISMVIPD
ncbi:hypothetical protein TWF718_004799 [Orbilia javanica]|uniref:Rad21/Rec8-like protein N-terminal domain-containing protein n=1 Tax=Orbilia javanica TaxID=47235 RepID=A0AAN8NC32_9PEZI